MLRTSQVRVDATNIEQIILFLYHCELMLNYDRRKPGSWVGEPRLVKARLRSYNGVLYRHLNFKSNCRKVISLSLLMVRAATRRRGRLGACCKFKTFNLTLWSLPMENPTHVITSSSLSLSAMTIAKPKLPLPESGWLRLKCFERSSSQSGSMKYVKLKKCSL